MRVLHTLRFNPFADPDSEMCNRGGGGKLGRNRSTVEAARILGSHLSPY